MRDALASGADGLAPAALRGTGTLPYADEDTPHERQPHL